MASDESRAQEYKSGADRSTAGCGATAGEAKAAKCDGHQFGSACTPSLLTTQIADRWLGMDPRDAPCKCILERLIISVAQLG